MPNERFRIALVFSPRRLIAAGVTSGDFEAGARFIADAKPLIDRFIQSVKAAAGGRGGQRMGSK